MADVCISILDIFFLLALLYVVNFYTHPLYSVSVSNISLSIFSGHPVLLIIVFFLLFTVKNIAGFAVSKKQYRFVYDVASRISGEKVTQYMHGSYQDYINVDSSVTNRKISQQPVEFSHYVLNGMQQVFSQVVLVSITLVAIIVFNPLLFPLLILILAPPVLLIAFFMKRKLDAAGINGKKTSEKAIQHLQEALAGFVEGNIYIKNGYFIDRYHRVQAQLNYYLSQRLTIQSLPPRLIEVFAVFGLLVLVLVNFFTAHGHSIELVTIGALMVAAYKIIPGIVKITNTIGQVKTYAFAATDLAMVPEPALNNSLPNESIRTIAFDNICFNYPGKNVLTSFSLQLNNGDFAIISGISGKGKTTFINLLLGFLTPVSGNIFINGNLACTEIRKNYWPQTSYIKQQPFFVHASVIENITLQERGYDEIKIRAITALTGIDKLITSFPQGLQTIITENGKNISGGQRQRIIFARALYKEADLLILDEPFNELDETSELEMLTVLKNIAASGRMVVLITHNKTAISFGNKSFLMDE